MMKLNEDVFYNLDKITDKTLEKLSKLEKNSVSKETSSNILGFSSNLHHIEDIRFDKLMLLLSKFDSSNLVKFMLSVNESDDELSKELLNSINRMSEENNDSAKYVSEKLLSLYRLSLFSSIFNEERLKSLKIALRNY